MKAGVVGMLADRTPGNDTLHPVQILGATANLPSGPFRMAALLQRPVVFMTGLYLGGNRYAIHFDPLADFSAVARDQRDAALEAAIARYAALLDQYCRMAPYNWFNFFDFWQPAPTTTLTQIMMTLPSCRVFSLRVMRHLPVALALMLAPVISHAAEWDIDQLMRGLAQTRSDHASFVEKKSIAMLDKPVESSGELFYTAPDHLEKRTIKPKPESMIRGCRHSGDRARPPKTSSCNCRIIRNWRLSSTASAAPWRVTARRWNAITG